ncbi:HHL114Cp [Eremothecium sinecaudum]|uniref:Decapping nuclease n=1 Tax=Eremothecium sinecaudum TaxID=45286 RepID=A0A0X8HW86_9SACH|nr:HHL114Cp [Eremothecium sinecaudum]AMD22656.1 HHL114Cp [Eremothecium sinecaudum]
MLEAKLFVQKRSQITTLKQPKELGYYSKTIENEFLIQSDTMLSYYYFPDSYLEKNFDLTAGAKKFKECMDTPDFDQATLHGLLDTIQHYEERRKKKVKADIITFRGIMRKLISSAFDNPKYANVNFRIVSFDGQLFIKEAKEKNSKGSANKNTNSLEFRNYYSGYKFEALTVLSKPFPETPRHILEKRHKKLVDNGEQYISVVRTGIGKCKLILGAEVDCVFDFKEENGDNLKHYAELKCTKAVNTVAEARSFERKIFKTWIQCFLVGINRIIYGFRDENYILKSVEEFTTQEIPILLKNNPQMTNVCLDAVKWYGAFTEWLMATIPPTTGDEIKAYTLVYEYNHLKLAEISESDPEYNDIVHGDAVLSESFKNWRKTLAQKDNNVE